MATNTLSLDGITSLLELIDLNKCLDYITFEIEGKTYKVRVVGTREDPWFCGKDVCEILGYSD
jgi:prophage antirepressor-like protein